MWTIIGESPQVQRSTTSRDQRAKRLTSLRAPRSPLIRLPAETRYLIWEFCLMENIKWEKRHRIGCRLSRRQHREPEPPPLNFPSCRKLGSESYLYDQLPSCDCARRQGLNILQACRQIYNEARPLFWRENTFCFPDSFVFAQDIKTNLSSKNASLIKKISVVSSSNTAVTSISYRDTTRLVFHSPKHLWTALSFFPSLECAEVSIQYLKGQCHRSYQNFVQKAVFLRKLWVAGWKHYKSTDESYFLWLKVRQSVPLDLDPTSFHDFVIGFQTNFLVHCDYAFKQQILQDVNVDNDNIDPGVFFELGKRFNDRSHVVKLRLRDGTTGRFPVYGLPNSDRTRLEMFQKIRAQDKMREKHGLCPLRLAQAEEEVQELRKIKKERKKNTGLYDAEAVEAARQARRKQLEAEEALTTRQEQERSKSELEEDISAIDNVRRQERRRVHRPE